VHVGRADEVEGEVHGVSFDVSFLSAQLSPPEPGDAPVRGTVLGHPVVVGRQTVVYAERMTVDPLIGRIVERVRATLPATVGRSDSRTFREVPAYPASPDPNLPADLTAHTETVFDAVLVSLLEGRRARREDFPITSSQARRRLRQGVALPDFLTGFRIGQETLWDAIVEAARPEAETRDAALHVAIHVMNVIEVGSSVGAVAYLEAQQLEMAEGDQVRRDLMEDLLAGRELAPGPKADLAAITDLTPVSRMLVVDAVPAPALRDGHSLREVVSAVRSVLGAGRRGIAVARQDHVVGVTPAGSDDEEVLSELIRAHADLERRGIPLSVGVSTIHDGLLRVPDAHREAVLARSALSGASGVRSVRSVTPLDYLLSTDDPTAGRLIPHALRSFIEEDLAAGGTQIETVRAFAEASLNAKVAAAELHVHVNTAYYRLDQISQRTGCDLRRFADLQQVLIAIRLVESAAQPTGTGTAAGAGSTSA
jgi:hypothetical protein